MKPSVYSLLPPLITILIAAATQEVAISLFCGVVASALISSGFAPWIAIKLFFEKYLVVTELGNLCCWQAFLESRRLFIFMFIVVLGSVIKLLKASGCSLAYACKIRKIAKNKVQAQFYAMALSFIMFIEEDLSIITSSSVTPALTDYFKIARLKLAYLIGAISVPLCSIIPISSWSAVIALFLENSGVSVYGEKMIFQAYPYFTYVHSIPFSFQAIFMIISALLIVATGLSYGKIGDHEELAEKTGNVMGDPERKPEVDDDECDQVDEEKYSLFDFFAPVLLLPCTILIGMLYTGGWSALGGTKGLVASMRSSKIEISLLCGGFIALLFSWTLFWSKGYLSIKKSIGAILRGIWMMKDSLITLSLAWTLANFLRTELKTGKYLSMLFMPYLSAAMMPLGAFLLSALMAFSIGSAWGTMAVIFPIALPMLPKLLMLKKPVLISQIPMLYPTIGAIMSGSLLGVGLSPISYLVHLNTKNLAVKHFEFIRGHFEYTLPAILASLLAFYIAGIPKRFTYLQNLGVSALAGAVAYALVFCLLECRQWQKNHNSK